ncbi:hypothetical protein ACYZT2_26780 [Pseudomonas sp. MDT1-85]
MQSTYSGAVFNSSERHDATLTFDQPGSLNGNINNGKMQYYGLNFIVTGTYTKPTRSFTLQAKANAEDGDEYGHGDSSLSITLKSSDNNDNKLNGKVTVKAGGPNVGKTYDIEFTKN